MHPFRVALIGNPNVGKTTVFNALTGAHQCVGNWSGVTVQKKELNCKRAGVRATKIIDLPGCYSLNTVTQGAIDEKITCDFLAQADFDLIVNVVDASHLERHLSLTFELLALGKPMVLALNMMDIAAKMGLDWDLGCLATELGCPVVPLVAFKKEGIKALEKQIERQNENLTGSEKKEESTSITGSEKRAGSEIIEYSQKIQKLLEKAKRSTFPKKNLTSDKIDTVVLHPVFGIPIFFLMMYVIFVITITLGKTLQDKFTPFLQWIFIDFPKEKLSEFLPTEILPFLTDGLGQGLLTTLSFIPVIACMFFCLALLERSGYMARVAFVMDRIMQLVGLSGKAFMPMILGFGCNVPAILSTRSLENRRERILTILMSPFMSCGARLAVYALFVSAFFPEYGHNIIFALYLLGIVIALMTGWALKAPILGDPAPLLLELPPYRWPPLIQILKSTRHRVWHFVSKAGVIIVPLCGVFALCTTVKTADETVVAAFGRSMTPIFAPMGIKEDNWPATVGLLTGVLAKEVVVGTLNTLYATENMAKKFGGVENAMAYLIFVLLYFPCVSVLATMARELNWRWAFFSALWTTVLAYGVAVIFYQMATWSQHPMGSCFWVMGMAVLLLLWVWGMRQWARYNVGSGDRLRGVQKAVPTKVMVV